MTSLHTKSARAPERAKFASALLAASFLTAPAAAQEVQTAALDYAANEEIVVTARFRQESVQDVPIAVTAIGADELEATGDFTFAQFQRLAPSMQVFAFNPRNTNINIRGLGSNVAVTNDGLDNGVGVYVDGVYYGRVGATQFDLVDLERIEVLRGPQGTLFGRNTTAGAISITTQAPDQNEFGGSFEASAGNYGYNQYRGSITGPIIENLLAARLSASSTERDGFIDNVRTGQDVHNYENRNVRGQLLFTPTADIRVRLIGDYNEQEQRCCISIPIEFLTTYANGAALPDNVPARLARIGYTPLPNDPFARRTDADSPFYANMDSSGVSAQLDWDFGPVALTAISAYREWNWDPSNDIDAFGVPIFVQAQTFNALEQTSHELRLASTGENTIDWVLGAYYYEQYNEGNARTEYGSDAGPWFVDPALVSATITRAALTNAGTISRTTPETETYAAFGQATWNATDQLALTLGLRYTHEEKFGTLVQTQFGPALTGPTAAAAQALRNRFAANASYSAAVEDDSLSGTFNISYHFNDDILGYATYSRGSKSGGLNLTVLPAGVDPIVQPETIDHYELGLKSDWLDGDLRLNLAIFHTAVQDYQTSIVDGDTSSGFRLYVANIEEVVSQGVELEAEYTPVDGVTFGLSTAFIDATYESYANGSCVPERFNEGRICDLSGEPLAGAPEFTAALSLDLVQPVDGLELYGRADYSYRSDFFTAVNNSPYSQVDAYGLANIRVGLRDPNASWDVSVWARNLFDEDYYQTRSIADTGQVSGLLGDPRTIGATVRTKF